MVVFYHPHPSLLHEQHNSYQHNKLDLLEIVHLNHELVVKIFLQAEKENPLYSKQHKTHYFIIIISIKLYSLCIDQSSTIVLGCSICRLLLDIAYAKNKRSMMLLNARLCITFKCICNLLLNHIS